MNTNRVLFLESFIKASPALKTVFLNQSGNPLKLLSDTSVIEVLSSKKSFHDFTEFALSDPLISKLDVIKHFLKKEVWIELTDGSALHFMFIHQPVAQGLSLLNTKDFYETAETNEFGMLVPHYTRQFEYHVIKVQFTGEPMADRFRALIKNMDSAARQQVFNHIQPKFNLVISVLEELFEPLSRIKYNMVVSLRHSKRNSLFMLTLRLIRMGIFKLLRFFAPKSKTFVPDPGQQHHKKASDSAIKKAENY
ncbi:MAG TPA: hypothetical protein VFW78_01685 [Bacteroidia bacterium]|nr:hypothetical protein [Bacteroidia bacterium]